MKIIKSLIGICDHRYCNPPTFNPMKITDYHSKISLRSLREGGDWLIWHSTHSHCMLGVVLMELMIDSLT